MSNYVTKETPFKNKFELAYVMKIGIYFVAQRLQGKVVAPLSGRRNVERMLAIDTAYIQILYAFNAEDINNPETYIDLQRLEIGKYYSKYYSQFVFNNDSLVWTWLKKHPNSRTVPMKIGPLGSKPAFWSEYKYSEYFKDYKANLLTEYARMPRQHRIPNCKYSEYIPVQNWVIQNDTLTVNGYLCQKATCEFRGRNYIAWFSMDIPISNGPWKFGGLPGLILKVYDHEQLYTFECVEVQHFQFPLKRYDFQEYKQIGRLKLLKYQRMLNENFYKAAGLMPINGGRFPSSVLYEPLELQ